MNSGEFVGFDAWKLLEIIETLLKKGRIANDQFQFVRISSREMQILSFLESIVLQKLNPKRRI